MAVKKKDESWKEEWKGMPEFIQEKKQPYAQLIVRFETQEDYEAFASLINQKLTNKTKSIWYPFKSHWGNGERVRYYDEP